MTELWCYVEGQRDIFPVSISPSCRIDDLKSEIYTSNKGSRSFDGCDPRDLTLMKVCYIVISM